jgi:hypothetical protein
LKFAKEHVAKIDVFDEKLTLFNGFVAAMTCRKKKSIFLFLENIPL